MVIGMKTVIMQCVVNMLKNVAVDRVLAIQKGSNAVMLSYSGAPLFVCCSPS